jgi:hypothetical protein
MNRAVLDTNILVSAGITAGGNCDRVVQMVLERNWGWWFRRGSSKSTGMCCTEAGSPGTDSPPVGSAGRWPWPNASLAILWNFLISPTRMIGCCSGSHAPPAF